MQPLNAFSNKPFMDWQKQYSLFFSKGASAFAKKYQSPLSSLIQGLQAEFGSTSDYKSFDSDEAALGHYQAGGELGDPLCCLRLFEIYSSKDNPFEVPINKEKAWVFLILAQFFGLCSPFGIEADITPIFFNFIVKEGDDPTTLKKSLELLERSTEPPAKKYKNIIKQFLVCYFSESEDSLSKFRAIFEAHTDLIDDFLVGAFILNLFTGNYEADAKIAESQKVYMYFNNRITDVFKLYNVTFEVQGETHAAVLVGLAVNVWHFLLWKGKHYKGEIDPCVHELVRMCKFMLNNSDKMGVSKDVLNIFTSILGSCYAKGFLVKKNQKKALEYYINFDEEETLHVNPNILFDKAKLLGKLGLMKEAEALNEKVYKRYLEIEEQLAIVGKEGMLPFEYYVLGSLEENLKSNNEKAKKYYQKAIQPIKDENFRPFESLAFQRKCIKKLEKFQRDN